MSPHYCSYIVFSIHFEYFYDGRSRPVRFDPSPTKERIWRYLMRVKLSHQTRSNFRTDGHQRRSGDLGLISMWFSTPLWIMCGSWTSHYLTPLLNVVFNPTVNNVFLGWCNLWRLCGIEIRKTIRESAMHILRGLPLHGLFLDAWGPKSLVAFSVLWDHGIPQCEIHPMPRRTQDLKYFNIL